MTTNELEQYRCARDKAAATPATPPASPLCHPFGFEPEPPKGWELPPGEAFNRASVERFMRIAAAHALECERARDPAHGWCRRGPAAAAVLEIMRHVLECQRVPHDHANTIYTECMYALDKWVDA